MKNFVILAVWAGGSLLVSTAVAAATRSVCPRMHLPNRSKRDRCRGKR